MFGNEKPPEQPHADRDTASEHEIGSLLATDTTLLGKSEILTFLARELGEAIDRAQGAPRPPSGHKN